MPHDNAAEHPTMIQRLFKKFEGEAFFSMMDQQQIFCETQYLPLDEKAETVEQVYVLNTATLSASMQHNSQHEANGLILSTGGHIIGRLQPHILDYDHPEAAAVKVNSDLNYEVVPKGDYVSIFNYGEKTHIGSKWAANGLSTCSWDDTLTHWEAVKALLDSQFDPWNKPFINIPEYENYTWVFIVCPPTRSCPDGVLSLQAAFNKRLNVEIKPYYLNLYANKWNFRRYYTGIVPVAPEHDSIKDIVDAGVVPQAEYVLTDYALRRVKVEVPYIREIRELSAIPCVGLRRVVKLVLTLGLGSVGNLLPAEFENLVYVIEDTIEDLALELEGLWDMLLQAPFGREKLNTRKLWAAQAMQYHCGHFLMLAYDGKLKDIHDLLAQIPLHWLTRRIFEKRGDVVKRELKKINKKREALQHNDVQKEAGQMVSAEESA